MRKVIIFLPLLIFATLAGFFFIGLGRDTSFVPSALIDKPVPDFDLVALKADKPGLKTDDLKGSVQVVNVFASWCVPCRAEHPYINALAKMGGVEVNGIAYKDKPVASRRFLAELGDPYTRIGVDEDGRAGLDWGVYGVPETYIIDASGTIRYKQVGPIDGVKLEEEILPLIKELAAQ